MIGLRVECLPGVTEDAENLSVRDMHAVGDLGLTESLARKIDGFDLPFRQFWHKQIESLAPSVFKSPALGTDLVGRSELLIRKVNSCQS